MTDLADSVDSLKRIVAVPGLFPSLYPTVTDDDLTALLMDGMADAQLDGLLLSYGYDDFGVTTPDLDRPSTALVVLYAGAILIRAELFNRKTNRHYASGTAVFDETQATNILRDILKEIDTRKQALIALMVTYVSGSAFWMADQYAERTWASVLDAAVVGTW